MSAGLLLCLKKNFTETSAFSVCTLVWGVGLYFTVHTPLKLLMLPEDPRCELMNNWTDPTWHKQNSNNNKKTCWNINRKKPLTLCRSINIVCTKQGQYQHWHPRIHSKTVRLITKQTDWLFNQQICGPSRAPPKLLWRSCK